MLMKLYPLIIFQDQKTVGPAKSEYNHFLEKYPDTDEREWINEQFAKMNEEANASH